MPLISPAEAGRCPTKKSAKRQLFPAPANEKNISPEKMKPGGNSTMRKVQPEAENKRMKQWP